MRGARALHGTVLGAVALLALGAAARPAEAQLSFEVYRREIEPIFIKRRAGHGPGLSACVSCHAHASTAFKLEHLQEEEGREFWSVEQSRTNFERIARLVAPGRPEASRLLVEALGPEAGGAVYHAGGVYWRSQDDPEWRVMADWVRAAGTAAPAAPAPPELDFAFFRTCVQKVFLKQRPGLARCADCHDQAPRNFAEALRPGETYWNEEASRRNLAVLMRLIDAGSPTTSRFLMHPLAFEAGGDPYHAGGRHWPSQDDAEWRMLAAWVRGETPTRCVLDDAATGGEEE